jgi:hypothetical protein
VLSGSPSIFTCKDSVLLLLLLLLRHASVLVGLGVILLCCCAPLLCNREAGKACGRNMAGTNKDAAATPAATPALA